MAITLFYRRAEMPDDDLFDDEIDQEEEPDADLRQTREYAKRQARKLKAAEKELEELRAFKAEAERSSREMTIAEVFRQIGLKPKHAKFYPSDGETTEEAIKVWAVAEELLSMDEAEAEEAAAPPEAGFTPTVVGESAPPSSKRYSRDEWEVLYRTNPNEALRVLNSGRVDMQIPEFTTPASS